MINSWNLLSENLQAPLYHCFTNSSSCPATILIFSYLSFSTSSIFWKTCFKNWILIVFLQFLEPGINLKSLKEALKNIVLACLERNQSRIAIKKVCSLSFCLFLKLLVFKNAILFKTLKKNAFYSNLSSKILQFTFPYDLTSLLNILRHWELGIEYIRQNWWSNFHEILVLLPKSLKKIWKNNISLIKKDYTFKFSGLFPLNELHQ